MIEHLPNLPEGVVGTMVAWLTHRVYTVESRLDAIAAAVGAQTSKKGKRFNMLLVIGGVWAACTLSACTNLSQRAKTTETLADGSKIERESKNRLIGVGTASTLVEKLKIQAGKTAAVGADSVQGTSTNDSASTLDSLTRLLQALPK